MALDQTLSRFTVRARIFLGFGLVLLLLALIAIIGANGLSSATDQVEEFSRVSDNTVRVAVLVGDFTEARRNVRNYANEGDAASAKAAREQLAKVRKDIAEITGKTVNPARREALTKMSGEIDGYAANFEKMAEARAAKEKLINEQLSVLGQQAREAMASIVSGAMASGDFEAAAQSSQTQEALMQARLLASRFTSTPTPKLADASRQQMTAFLGLVHSLEERLRDPARKRLAKDAAAQAESYAAAFGQMVDRTMQVEQLANTVMRNEAMEIAKLANQVRTAQVERLDTLKGQTISGMGRATVSGLVVSGAALAVGLLLALLIAGSIVTPVQAMTDTMTKLASGDKTVAIPATENKDEIGEMARAVQVFKDGLIRAEQLEAEARADQEREVARGRKRELLTADFDVMIRRVIAKVDNTVQNVHSTSTSLHAAAEQTSRQSAAVAAAAEQATANIQTVASAAEELGASTHEISRRVQDTTRITQEAVDGVQTADATVEGLSTAAQKIGEIVSLINDIAAQTNLLALNATIEAARAGEAGKGFAVVANEVKHLATQTAKATSEIAEQIGGIQNSTQSAVNAIKTVGAAIGRVDEVVSSIAAAVEEQNAATQEIVRNVQEAANGNHEVTSNISEVSSAAHMTGEMASNMFKVAEVLEESGTSLGKHVETFLASVQAV
ncbi:methyl-accepting chemotaxis protein [Paramagnetospirillum magneticum]|uniref:Methyl-accepting chemotaxis protein n=1 Tax=Paramagnetospirillum magneticum (strain ATCC 700264 / AMB-1) TaxID=342108 RepID=Q2W6Z3_PARM1|nr:methyl-accepting chemotaxis protein [Paramagnetospirillum magneticum]BAE50382.1 Methyl-accepting chemotaxis protein [Paramagnetospirillum magneticum AMB-1]